MSKWLVDIHGELEGDYELICKAESTIPLDKVKEAREEIENEVKFWSEPSKYDIKPIGAIRNAKAQSYKHCLAILDKLIESEEK